MSPPPFPVPLESWYTYIKNARRTCVQPVQAKSEVKGESDGGKYSMLSHISSSKHATICRTQSPAVVIQFAPDMQRAKDGKDGVLPIALGGIPTVGKVMIDAIVPGVEYREYLGTWSSTSWLTGHRDQPVPRRIGRLISNWATTERPHHEEDEEEKDEEEEGVALPNPSEHVVSRLTHDTWATHIDLLSYLLLPKHPSTKFFNPAPPSSAVERQPWPWAMLRFT
ncbi:hypothetical protein BZA05DRAFT_435099 [Tricharina praecox]|uniref:uncharacterized protein n=1 Tax=Tricharina praecox TaxID=43433 RepID=UPI00221FB112|nr:uncharacterized protein BZA05DRAFT_435099 [Tricharina praecox]KAI5854911.1 hypothetical protein BZA05DRAFT_435099 [Tricharina praecox]